MHTADKSTHIWAYNITSVLWRTLNFKSYKCGRNKIKICNHSFCSTSHKSGGVRTDTVVLHGLCNNGVPPATWAPHVHLTHSCLDKEVFTPNCRKILWAWGSSGYPGTFSFVYGLLFCMSSPLYQGWPGQYYLDALPYAHYRLYRNESHSRPCWQQTFPTEDMKTNSTEAESLFIAFVVEMLLGCI